MTVAELLRADLEEHEIEEDEPILEDDDDDEDDTEDEDEKDDDDVEGGDAGGRSRQSRSEKKSRKAMEKLGMKAITGVSRVMYVLSKPDVFKSSQSDTYVMFGELKVEDPSTQLPTQAAEQFKAPGLSSVISKDEPSVATAQDDEEVDDTDVDQKDVELVMTQTSVSRSRAVKVLKAVDGDIVSAIMELTN
ncbi:unnamed protein product [Triticum turgidum subsp. durum]|uniref:NAC-A/B domain-containing protein n=1 Tax=Triticum turgidum subsp. durum TaxID=4567 RepID=A0A9R0RYL3_TRITD|nr:unnamed protein product [Triticum turgidum subsp. durum]